MTQKRIKIQAVRNPVNPQETFHLLEKGLLQIYLKNASLISFEELYRSAYNMVLYKHGDYLYKGVQTTVNDQIQRLRNAKIAPYLPKMVHAQMNLEIEFLRKLKDAWEEHELCLKMIRDVLMYMDRTYVKSANLPDVYSMGQLLFRDLVLQQEQIQKYLISSVLHQIDRERNGEVIDIFLIKRISDMLQEYTIQTNQNAYQVLLETAFLQTSRAFYAKESLNLLEQVSMSEYIKRTRDRLEEESTRVTKYLSTETLEKILQIVEQEMLGAHACTLLNMDSGLVHLMYNHEYADLALCYHLFSRFPKGLEILQSECASHLKKRVECIHATGSDSFVLKRSDSGLSSVSDSMSKIDHLTWMESMLKLKDEFDGVLKNCFENNPSFEIRLNDALAQSLNVNPHCAEWMSLYIDDCLKRGIKGKSEEEIDSILDKTISLFRFLSEKDVFDRYYKQHLAKRLLLGKSVSEDAERAMISKLKMECGYQFTSKLEGMLTDIHISEETSSDFARSLTGPLPTLKIHVLTSTLWPLHSSSFESIQFPKEMESLKMRFESFYLSRHSGRRLSWIWNLGSADLRVQFDSGVKEINVSTFGMIVLLKMFQSSEDRSVSFEEILSETGIPSCDLKRVLQSLSLTKFKILLKSSKGKEILPNDTFSFHSKLSCPLHKIKIPNITSGNSGQANSAENEEERNKTMERIDEDRKHEIEAAIVRIMKARKGMYHSPLVAEVIDQLKSRFSPSPAMIKKRIESLIEREYMDRDAQDRKKYIYMA